MSVVDADLPFSRDETFVLINGERLGQIELRRERSKTYHASVFGYRDFDVSFDQISEGAYVIMVNDNVNYLSILGVRETGPYYYGIAQSEGDQMHFYSFPRVGSAGDRVCEARQTIGSSLPSFDGLTNPFSGLAQDRLGQDLQASSNLELQCGFLTSQEEGTASPILYNTLKSVAFEYVREERLSPEHPAWIATLRRL